MTELPTGLPDRYEPLTLLGEGAMGEVFRVRDRLLLRTVAMKVVKAEILTRPRGLARFHEEARIVAQLQHPGIVPVLDLGELADGRVWFTMREISGVSLRQVLRELRSTVRTTHPDGDGFRRVIDVYQRACEAVGYAHARGVIHRDLKPAHVMTGEHGEVLVVDWGLARVLGRASPEIGGAVELPPGREATAVGTVGGTPGYLSPEQARGEVDALGPPADVWSLGAVLYTMLVGRPPYGGGTAREAVELARRAAPIPAPSAMVTRPIDEDLERLCLDCLAADPAGRPADAAELATRVAEWLDGEGRRERARVALDAAREALRAARDREAEADARVPPPEADAEARWDVEDAADALRREAAARREEGHRQLHLALAQAPDLWVAKDLLADELVARHAALEAAGRFAEAAALEPGIAAHHRGRHAAYLAGDGALTLVTDAPCEVLRHRVEVRRRRRVLVPAGSLGSTPLVEVPIPRGDHVLVLRALGRRDVIYPVRIRRGEHWDGVPPGGTGPALVWLPRAADLGPDEVYVPPGWTWSGCDSPVVSEPLPRRRLWCDGFAIDRTPVSNRAWAALLDRWVAEGREAEALALVPRSAAGEPCYGRAPDGTFTLPGPPFWGPDHPVVRITAAHAEMYAAAQGRRLPMDLEWEKAARGVDERPYPWGDLIERGWAALQSTTGTLPVGTHPIDASPYGLLDCAGNVAEWTAEGPGPDELDGERIRTRPRSPPGPRRRVRGGLWNFGLYFGRVDLRRVVEGAGDGCGLRTCRSWPPRPGRDGG